MAKQELMEGRTPERNPKYEAVLAHLKTESEKMTLYGKQDAELPNIITEDYYRVRVFNPLQALANQVAAEVQAEHKPLSNMASAQDQLPSGNSEADDLKRDIRNDEEAAFDLTKKIENTPTNPAKKRLWQLKNIFTKCISALDAVVVAFSLIGELGMILSFLYAVVFALCIYIGSSTMARWIMKAKKIFWQRVRFCASVLLAAIIFYFLAGSRTVLAERTDWVEPNATEIQNADTGEKSQNLMAGLACFFFLVSLACTVAVYRTDEEINADKELETWKSDLAQVLDTIAKKKAKIAAIEEAQTLARNIARESIEIAVSLCKDAVAIATEGLSNFGKSYVSNRPDYACPPYISNPPKITINSNINL